MRTVSVCHSLSAGDMMAEVFAVDDGQTISSSSAEFRDPLGVNYHLSAAVDDESDEFDFDVSSHFCPLRLSPSCCYELWLFAGSPLDLFAPGSFAPWLIRP